MKKTAFLFVFLFHCFFAVFAQNTDKKLDSLQTLLYKAKTDTLKVHLITELVKSKFRTKGEDTEKLLEEAEVLANKTKHPRSQAKVALTKATISYTLGRDKECLESAEKASKIYQSLNDEENYLQSERLKGSSYTYLGRVQEAEEILKAIVVRSDNKYLEIKKVALLSLSTVYINQTRYKDAMHILEEAEKLSIVQNDSTNLAGILNNKYIILSREGNYQKAVTVLLRSIKIYQNRGNNNGLGMGYLNLGIIYLDLKKPEEALKSFELSLQAKQKINDAQIGIVFQNIVNVYRLLKEYDKGLEYAQKAIQSYEKQDDRIGIALCKQSMAEILTERDNQQNTKANYEKAKGYFYEALTIVIREGDKYHEAKIKINLAEIYRSTEQYDSALSVAKQALQAIKGTKHLDEERNANKVLAKIYLSREIKDKTIKKEMWDYYEKSQSLTDSIAILKYKKDFSNQLLEYEKATKEAENQKLRADKAEQAAVLQQRNYTIGIGLGLFLFLMVAGFLFYQREIKNEKIVAQELMQKKIGQDLHDNQAQKLIVTARKAEEQYPYPEIYQDIMTIKEEIRFLSYELKGMIGTDLVRNIDVKIKEYKMLYKGSSFEFTYFPQQGWESLDEHTARELFRILQNALANATQHAHAKHIAINLMWKDKEVEATVIDDGVGIAPTANKGLGITSIEERAKALQGKATWESNNGTELTVTIPTKLKRK